MTLTKAFLDALADADPRPYREIFLHVLFTRVDGAIVQADVSLADEKQESDDAEVCIPHHTDEAVYAITCSLTGIPNFQPAIEEAVYLQKRAAALVEMWETRRGKKQS